MILVDIASLFGIFLTRIMTGTHHGRSILYQHFHMEKQVASSTPHEK